MSWIKNFTIAIVEENYTNIGELIDTMPHFETLEEAQTACALIQEALVIMEREKANTFEAMQKLKKTRKFIDTSPDSYLQEYRG
ncbi:hypothetical protein [Sulfurospirillum arsenophilum]|uniref:hypothetical protein n=1 Tax=Sulfurospirillum arsenophilum TaxID=56698 RepID=UPI0005A72C39|nr:hypothetical protein [Sulfurospirillum arsenophilum]